MLDLIRAFSLIFLLGSIVSCIFGSITIWYFARIALFGFAFWLSNRILGDD